ncbi:MAG: DNA-processing protein DprA [Sphaerochaeta sp.]|nr:DNA-processing protein DprA [Sphaerochaeta sp.]MDD3928443.1 DNA-processing protein DprA [Sphaerochaeta sp.]
MKLSVLLAISLLRLSTAEKLHLVRQDPSLPSLLRRLGNDRTRLHRMLSFLSDGKAKACFFGMSCYPATLAQLENPPFRLLYTGELPQPSDHLLTLCGTRYPDGLGSRLSYAFALEASANGCALVTSNSRGSDRAALYACLDLGTPGYVVCDAGLATKRIQANSLLTYANVISPFEPDDQAIPFRCLARNVVSTALGLVTVVLQAPLHSGALACATAALDAGRDVYVHEQALQSPTLGEGGLALVGMGCPTFSCYAELACSLDWSSSVQLRQTSSSDALYRFGSAWYSLEYD